MQSYRITARYFDSKTDSKDEIDYSLKALAIAEEKYPSIVPSIYNLLTSAYNDLGNYGEAFKYLRKAKMLIEKSGNDPTAGNIYLQFADAFDKLSQSGSLIHYANLWNEYLVKHPNPAPQRLFLSLMGLNPINTIFCQS